MKCNVCLTREIHCLNRKERNIFKPESDYTLLLLVWLRLHVVKTEFFEGIVLILRQIEWTWFRVRENFHILFSFASSLLLWRENIGLFRSLWVRISCSFELCSSLLLFFFSWSWSVLFFCHEDEVFLYVLCFCRPSEEPKTSYSLLSPWFFLVVYLPPLTSSLWSRRKEKKTAAGDSLYL